MSARDSGAPLVSVAVPLYRSARFVDVVARNLETLDYPNLEFIISDRHGADDAIDILERRFGTDHRIRFLRRFDRVGWVEHYNSLLAEARGRYMMWCPHDDSYPSDYISRLVECLEERPEVVLAFGRIRAIDPQGRALGHAFLYPGFARRTRWTMRSSIELLFWGAALPFRGVFRRDAVIRVGHRIRPTLSCYGADTFWVFGLSLLGPLQHDEGAFCWKRFYPESTSARAVPTLAHVTNAARVLLGYMNAGRSKPLDWLLGAAGISLWSSMRAGQVVARHLPDRTRSGLGRALRRIWPASLRPGFSRT